MPPVPHRRRSSPPPLAPLARRDCVLPCCLVLEMVRRRMFVFVAFDNVLMAIEG